MTQCSGRGRGYAEARTNRNRPGPLCRPAAAGSAAPRHRGTTALPFPSTQYRPERGPRSLAHRARAGGADEHGRRPDPLAVQPSKPRRRPARGGQPPAGGGAGTRAGAEVERPGSDRSAANGTSGASHGLRQREGAGGPRSEARGRGYGRARTVRAGTDTDGQRAAPASRARARQNRGPLKRPEGTPTVARSYDNADARDEPPQVRPSGSACSGELHRPRARGPGRGSPYPPAEPARLAGGFRTRGPAPDTTASAPDRRRARTSERWTRPRWRRLGEEAEARARQGQRAGAGYGRRRGELTEAV